jgi:hypothetical protein
MLFFVTLEDDEGYQKLPTILKMSGRLKVTSISCIEVDVYITLTT